MKIVTLLLCHVSFVKSGQGTPKKGNPNFIHDKTWPDFTTLKSRHVYGSAVTVDGNGNVVVLHRGDVATNKLNGALIKEDVIMILSPSTGKIIATWGSNLFAKPHGIEIHEKSIFITDVLLHQVFKFSHDPQTGLWKSVPEIELGEKFVPGNDASHFCSPADVAILSHTNTIFVADGYCNSRIIKFDKSGTYLGEFGAGTSNPLSPIVDFNVTHAVTIATPEPLCVKNNTNPLFPIIFVADRNNGRVQSFSENGSFLYEIPYERFGYPREMLLSLAFSSEKYCSVEAPYGTLYAVRGHLQVGESQIFEILVGPSGYHFKDSFNYSDVNAINGDKSQIETPHDIAVSRDGYFVYVVEAYNFLILKRFKSTSIISSNASGTCTLRSVILMAHYLFLFLVSLLFFV